MVTAKLKQDLLWELEDVVVDDTFSPEPAVASLYDDAPTIVDTLSAEFEDERFQLYPITDISVRLIDGERRYVTSSPAGPVTMSAARAYKKLKLAKQFDEKVKSNYLPDIKTAKKIAAEHFPDYTKVATTLYNQRVKKCLDGKINLTEENELIAHFSDSGIATLIDGENTAYMQRAENDFQGMNRDQAFETLRAFANYQHLMKNNKVPHLEHAKDLAKQYFQHLVPDVDQALDMRIRDASDDSFWKEHARADGMGQYVIRN